ncbi:natural killer cells antigen CD94-like isoform X3 [Melanerpes formicivorus]|uniref:natural killer cells antigen CD94-like isoform X3 n=1 Tax=Melanerpes formicivorus TaxID=211600 RepID=UPI00358E35AB
MEDEEGYTTLNLRPSASGITPRYPSSNKYSGFKAPASCATVDIFQVPKDAEEGKKLQEMRKALCFEVKEKNETKCAVCPASWHSSGADNCFYISKQKKTWKESQEFCSSRNSTLLVLKDRAKMASLPWDSQFYWVGLSYMSEKNGWYWEDGTAFSKQETNWAVLYDNIFCASIYGQIIYASNPCSTKQLWICEKVAVELP